LFLALSAVLGGIACSLLLGRGLLGREHSYAKAEFRIAVDTWIRELQRVLVVRLGTVSTTAGFFRGSDVNDRKDFSVFATQIMKNSGSIEMLAWAPRIPTARRKTHEDAVRHEGFPKYEINQRNKGGRLVAASQRDKYYPILFAEPSRQHQSLIGFDLGSDAAFGATIRRAMASSSPAVAGSPRLLVNKANHILLYVVEPAQYESMTVQEVKRPANQPELDGFVLGVFRIDAMLKKWINLPVGIDAYISNPLTGNGTASVYTRLAPLPAQGDVSQSAGEPPVPPFGGARASGDIEFAETHWTVEFVASPSYLAGYRTGKPTIALLAGLLITGLSVGYFWVLTGQIASIERLATERWRNLCESDRYIRHLVDDMGDAIFLHNERGKILDVNKQACDSLEYGRLELLSMTIADLEAELVTSNPGQHAKLSAEEYPLTFERVYRRKDGTTFPVEVRLTLAGMDVPGLTLATVRDISGRKRAEKALRDAIDLYDGLMRQLTAVLDKFQKVGRSGDGDSDRARNTFDEDVRSLREAMAETHLRIGDLRPAAPGESASLPPSST
jgi:PAS domain S-box-containing protein